ncbi:hypothetical protein V501_03911 [Pseudogymnoascus sp. VKM F-4519 (FW-2642)]|nr:hypothetical protein V501_03911 [Pseudogymnoascus sp. VKM F-4519 (FW-2642)]
MASRTERFERKANPKPVVPSPTEETETVRFEPEEEAELLRESNERKAAANEKFAAGEYGEAIKIYAEAISSCPNYLFYERAVLNSNVAACHLKLGEWKETVKAASESVDDLDRLDPTKLKENKKENRPKGDDGKEIVEAEEEEADEEIVSVGAAKAENTSEAARRKTDIERIRSKALLRRARARSELGGWSALGGAEEGALEDVEPITSRPQGGTKAADPAATADKSSTRKGDGRYDGAAQAAWEWHSEAVRLVHR